MFVKIITININEKSELNNFLMFGVIIIIEKKIDKKNEINMVIPIIIMKIILIPV